VTYLFAETPSYGVKISSNQAHFDTW